jgi:hypothetical protein
MALASWHSTCSLRFPRNSTKIDDEKQNLEPEVASVRQLLGVHTIATCQQVKQLASLIATSAFAAIPALAATNLHPRAI